MVKSTKAPVLNVNHLEKNMKIYFIVFLCMISSVVFAEEADYAEHRQSERERQPSREPSAHGRTIPNLTPTSTHVRGL